LDEEVNIASIIIDAINTIFQTLFSSIDTNVSSILDEVTFINSDILDTSYFSNIFGTSSSNGILLVANALIIGFMLFAYCFLICLLLKLKVQVVLFLSLYFLLFV
jgi:hypothetical protein